MWFASIFSRDIFCCWLFLLLLLFTVRHLYVSCWFLCGHQAEAGSGQPRSCWSVLLWCGIQQRVATPEHSHGWFFLAVVPVVLHPELFVQGQGTFPEGTLGHCIFLWELERTQTMFSSPAVDGLSSLPLVDTGTADTACLFSILEGEGWLLGLELRALHLPGKCCPAKLHLSSAVPSGVHVLVCICLAP